MAFLLFPAAIFGLWLIGWALHMCWKLLTLPWREQIEIRKHEKQILAGRKWLERHQKAQARIAARNKSS